LYFKGGIISSVRNAASNFMIENFAILSILKMLLWGGFIELQYPRSGHC